MGLLYFRLCVLELNILDSGLMFLLIVLTFCTQIMGWYLKLCTIILLPRLFQSINRHCEIIQHYKAVLPSQDTTEHHRGFHEKTRSKISTNFEVWRKISSTVQVMSCSDQCWDSTVMCVTRCHCNVLTSRNLASHI